MGFDFAFYSEKMMRVFQTNHGALRIFILTSFFEYMFQIFLNDASYFVYKPDVVKYLQETWAILSWISLSSFPNSNEIIITFVVQIWMLQWYCISSQIYVSIYLDITS